MNLAIGCDPNANNLKQALTKVIEELGHTYKDFGSDDVVYANVAFEVAKAVANGMYDRGVLLCGTGIGMCISANKVQGAFAALAENTYAAQKAVTSNRANIICMGSFTLGIGLAQSILRAYLTAEYVPGTPSDKKFTRYFEFDTQRTEIN